MLYQRNPREVPMKNLADRALCGLCFCFLFFLVFFCFLSRLKFHSLLLYWGSSIIFRNTSAAWNEALRPYINTGESLFFLMHTHTQIHKKEKNTATHFGELSVKTARYIYLHNLFFLDSHFSVFSAFGIWASVQFKCCFVLFFCWTPVVDFIQGYSPAMDSCPSVALWSVQKVYTNLW